MFDGAGALNIYESHNIEVSNLEITGPALEITGEEATANRVRLTGLDQGGCGGWSGSETEETCQVKPECAWSSSLKYCHGASWSYYSGTGIEMRRSTDILVFNNEVHHCTASAIRAD